MLPSFTSKILFIFFLSEIIYGKYTIIADLNTASSVSEWTDMKTNTNLNICNAKVKRVGLVPNTNMIHWKRTYALPQSSIVYVYFEYQISGSWTDYLLQVFANNILVYSKALTLVDVSKTCAQNFQYESNVYFMVNQYLDQLTLEIKVNQQNVGLFIQNIILSQRSQTGRNTVMPFIDYIAPCTDGTGLKFTQYYCQCQDFLVYKENLCQASCGQDYVFDADNNACYYKQHCSACNSNTPTLTCDSGYFKFVGEDISESQCLANCPIDYYEDTITKTCLNFVQYASSQLNNGYPVNQYFFYKGDADFFHFFQANDFTIKVVSNPVKVKERSFIYFNNKFVVGTFNAFEAQTIQIFQIVYKTQYKIKFKAIAHFIDFYPQKIELYINEILQPDGTITQSAVNIQGTAKDYQINYDVEVVRTEFYPVTQNVIQFYVEQPLQSGSYRGYFYVEDINIFQFECQPGCEGCFTYKYCTPCLNPDNKNPADCTCVTGYALVNDICIVCPTYCTTCADAGVCLDCKATTLRINSPACDACPNDYYLDPAQDDCQPCINGCKVCSNDSQCTHCKSGYFKTSSNLCTDQCPDGQFNDLSDANDPKCSVCDDNCLSCEDTATKCTDCDAQAVLVNNHCYTCLDGTYLSGTSCVNCIQNCQYCSSNICTLCQDTYFYLQKTNQCLSECDDGYFQNSPRRTCDTCDINCLTCAGGSELDCLTCPPAKILNIINIVVGECSSNCKSGYYKVSSSCVKCWKGCSACLDATQACLVCASNYYRLKVDGNCYQKCPDGYYNNPVSFTCSNCYSSCKTCVGNLETNCLSCNAPLAYYQSQCLTDCPDGYGNINDVCTECSSNCKSCFGTLPNQCLSCMKGIYFLNNQCYVRCPQFYIKLRPQYICKCKYDNCVTCTDTQFYLNNVCYNPCPNGYFGFNGLCIKCDITCATCSGTRYNECLTCNTGLVYYQQQCLPHCLGNLYRDATLNECKTCDPACLGCSGPNSDDCTACEDGLLLSTSNECVDECPAKQYPVLSEKVCYDCHNTCESCYGSGYQNCLTCPTNQFLYLSECVAACPDGFSVSSSGLACDPNTEIVIAQCSYQCQTCQLTARFCTKCSSNRASNSPNCDCEEGYYDDQTNALCLGCENNCSTCTGISTHCIKCKGDRLLPYCECPQQYYDDLESVYCTKCEENCLTCNETECIRCLGDRINPPSCICSDGYYEAFQLYCQECSFRCSTCLGGALLCLTCSDIREFPPSCSCPDGYSEINEEEECLLCDVTCRECNLDGCISCAANRVGPVDGKCECDEYGIDRQNIGSVYCTDCKTGVPFFGLNDDFTGFSIDFGSQVLLTDSVTGDLCTAFFTPESLAKLGTNPKCDYDLNVLFGENPTLEVGDNIYLKKVFIKAECLKAFEIILSLPLSIPQTFDTESHLPNVKFKDVPKLNICNELEIIFDDLFFNGGQKFKVISWQQKLPLTPQLDYSQILYNAKISKAGSIKFPSKMFAKDQVYKISITIESFAKLQNTFYFQFTGILQSAITMKPNLQSNQFHRYDQIQIIHDISYSNCLEQNPPDQVLFYEIILKNKNQQIVNGTFTDGLIDGFKTQVPLSFIPYYFNFENPYTIVLNTKLTRPDYTVTTSDSFNMYIVPSIPILKVKGGNRMVGYTDILYLNSTINDLDLTSDEAKKVNYQCYWSCQDIVNQTACQNQANETIEFDFKCNQFIPAKSFAPYSVFNFELKIMKQEVFYSTKVSIQFIEIDLPTLSVVGPNQNQIHNYYDEFIYKLQYPGINPDILMYAGAVIYDQKVQATFQFYYLEFKFKIQNYFTDFDLTKGNVARLRLSIYDPRFIMPSLNTQILTMNIPPQQCQLSYQIDDIFIEFIDTITVDVVECQDSNTPLIYSVMLFPNSSIYQSDLEQSHFYNYLMLASPQSTSHFEFTLPFLNRKDALLVFNIQDSLEGIVNITKSVTVKQLVTITEQQFKNYQLTLSSLDDQLIGYLLITERLKSISDLQNYKQEVLFELIDQDKNQSFLSNQTETLYHCISNILSQNVSLIQYNETLLINQLNYRIELAKDKLNSFMDLQKNNKLTSSQNIDKTNYVKQYYTFTNILSSYINYRVAKNVSAIEIQDQLSAMTNYLQDVSVANEPMYKIQSNSVNMNLGFLTTKMVGEIAGSTVKDDSTQSLRLLETQADSTPKQYNSSTNFFKFSQTRFIDNPFYATDGFPKNSSGYQAVDPKMIKVNATNQSNQLSSPMNFKFPVAKTLPANTTTKCIAKLDSGKWSADVCKSVQKNGETVCECNSVNPTSIMDSLNYLMDKAAQVFSLDTLLAFASFPFYKTIVFYFYIIITGGYGYIVYWGMKVDNVMFEKIAIEKEIQAAEQKLKEEQEKQQKEEDALNQKSPTDQNKLKQQKEEDALNQKSPTDQNKLKDDNETDSFVRKKQIEINDPIQQQQQDNQTIFGQAGPSTPTPENQGPIILDIPKFAELLNKNDQKSLISSKNSMEQQENPINIESQPFQSQNQDEQQQNKNDEFIQESLTKIKAYIEYLKYFHQILSIIYKDDETKPRGLRASIIYTSILGSLAVLFVFGKIENITLTLSLALITAPLNKIYQVILEKMLSSLKKIVRMLGGIFMIVSAAGISYTMLAGLVLSGSVETANQWSYIFIGTFSLDNLIYSPIQLIIQYGVHIGLIHFPIISKLMNQLLDSKGKEFLQQLMNKLKEY